MTQRAARYIASALTAKAVTEATHAYGMGVLVEGTHFTAVHGGFNFANAECFAIARRALALLASPEVVVVVTPAVPTAAAVIQLSTFRKRTQ